MSSYDSTQDTLTHIRRVQELMGGMLSELYERARVHDKSKLESPEKLENLLAPTLRLEPRMPPSVR